MKPNIDALKQQAAERALDYLHGVRVLGVGTGSTAECFIAAIERLKSSFDTVIASSTRTEQALKAAHIPFSELNSVSGIDLYVDGADEVNQHRYLIKGLGGALTQEKILAGASKQFICITDQSKRVDVLGKKAVPVPVEVIPMARSFVARQIVKLGGEPIYRQGVITDNGNVILDVYHLDLTQPPAMERTLNEIPGVVENGIFARRPADVLIIASDKGVEII